MATRPRARWLLAAISALPILAAGPAAALLPWPVARAFADAGIPPDAVALYVHEAGAPRPLVSHQSSRPVNPASTIKLLTTYAALDLLGPAYRWRTDAWWAGARSADVLDGDLIIKGRGDPAITLDTLEGWVRALRATGVRDIRGDLVLDRSYFAADRHDPAAFDNEPLKAYNVGPDPLLVNFKAVRLVIAPDVAGVSVRAQPPLPGLAIVNRLALSRQECGDWRTLLQPVVTGDASRSELVFSGRFPAACGEKAWNLSVLDHANYLHQAFTLYWRQSGGRFDGSVRDGRPPLAQEPVSTLVSPPLALVVRDINKLSNNVMARQLFLTLASVRFAPPLDARQSADVLREWLAARRIRAPGLVVENGSGLSRNERISAQALGALLRAAYAGPHAGDFLASLPVAAVDGTMRSRLGGSAAAGFAYLKTGTLDGVRAIAGYVFDRDGRPLVVVCMVNHRNASAARPAIDALVEWVFASAWSSQQPRRDDTP